MDCPEAADLLSTQLALISMAGQPDQYTTTFCGPRSINDA
jgi:hypothetical protein